jgi:hypothetical protein
MLPTLQASLASLFLICYFLIFNFNFVYKIEIKNKKIKRERKTRKEKWHRKQRQKQLANIASYWASVVSTTPYGAKA